MNVHSAGDEQRKLEILRSVLSLDSIVDAPALALLLGVCRFGGLLDTLYFLMTFGSELLCVPCQFPI